MKLWPMLQVGHERVGLAVLLLRPPLVPRCLNTGSHQPPGLRCTSRHQNNRATRNKLYHRTRSRRGAVSSGGRAASAGAVGKGTAPTAVDCRRRRRCPEPETEAVLAVGTWKQYRQDKKQHYQNRHKQQCPTIHRLYQRKNVLCSVLSPGNRWRPLRPESQRNMPSRRNSKRKERKARYGLGISAIFILTGNFLVVRLMGF